VSTRRWATSHSLMLAVARVEHQRTGRWRAERLRPCARAPRSLEQMNGLWSYCVVAKDTMGHWFLEDQTTPLDLQSGMEHEMLNFFGADGWELVTVTLGESGFQPRYYFKRPKGD
jgi:hypothetical protein